MTYVCWLTEERATEIASVGGKGANLSRLKAHGFPVPAAFCVTADAYRYLLNVTGLDSVLEHLVAQIDVANPADVAKKSAAIRELIEQQPIPSDIAAEIRQSYITLGREMACRYPEATPVAVRSSATAEDLPQASFAGQQETYLNIRGADSLLRHVRRCWASLWTARAIMYRQENGFDHRRVALAVLVQGMVNPAISGVMFTANPVNGSREECVINASWGLGEAIVSGAVNPDTVIINKLSGRILQQEIARKERQIVFAGHSGAVEEAVPPELQLRSVLGERDAAQLVALGARIEQAFGTPQDVEWAREAGEWYILQARPITTLKPRAPAAPRKGHYSRAMFVEIFPEGICPAFLSVVCPLLSDMLKHALSELGTRDLPRRTASPEMEAVAAFMNQPYIHLDYVARALEARDEATREYLLARFSNVFAAEVERKRAGTSRAQLVLVWRLWRFVRRFQRTMPALLRDYHSEIKSLQAVELNAHSDRELLADVRRACFAGAGPLLNNDFLLIAATGAYQTILKRLLSRRVGPRSEEQLNLLLSGISGNIVMETNALLWKLAEHARQDPAVGQLIRSAEPQQALAEMASLPEAGAFRGQLAQFLETCGHREQHFDIMYPTWGEDPAPVIGFVRSYLEMERGAAPAEQALAAGEQRAAETERVVAQMSSSPVDRLWRRPLFNYFLGQAQWLLRERDTMHFEWTRLFPPLRRIELELGRRWQRRGLLDEVDDIFFLTLQEQEAVAEEPRACQETVRGRRAEYEANAAGPWPVAIKDGVCGWSTSVTRPEAAGPWLGDHYAGIGASPGSAAGAARIVRSPGEFQQLQPGEILVAPSTNPAWTPLFAVAGGLVTELGGLLSHGAIVAREYGIPAVMSVEGATSLLVDGEEIVVDGDRGRVTRLAKTPGEKAQSFAQTRTERA